MRPVGVWRRRHTPWSVRGTADCVVARYRARIGPMAGPAVASVPSMMRHSRGRLRWWGAAAGVVAAVIDTLSLVWLGATLEMGGRDVTWLVAGWFGVSFALL